MYLHFHWNFSGPFRSVYHAIYINLHATEGNLSYV
jgi:hypothetical protein